MIDLIAASSRATAGKLAEVYGPEMALEVETVLAERRDGARPDQYLDPVSLGGLIVSIATLAWTVYSDCRKERQQVDAGTLSRAVHERLGGTTQSDAVSHSR